MHVPGRPKLLAATLLLAAPGLAHADKFVLAPLDARDAVASENVTSLLAAELDFQPAVSSLSEIRTRPSGASCLGSTTCLGALLREGGGERLITGALTTTSQSYTLDMVLFDGRTVVRREQFTLGASPTALADGMTGVVKALLTGKTPAKEAEAVPTADAFALNDDDDFLFESAPAPRSDDAARRRAEDEARRRADDEARRRAEEERRLEEERRARIAAEERRRAEDEARRRSEEESRRRAAEARTVPATFDPDAISFSTSTRDIQVESPEDITFGPTPSSSPSGYDPLADLDDLDDLDGFAPPPSRSAAPSRYEDLDAGRTDRGRTASTPARSSTQAKKPAGDVRHGVNITARGGFSPFQGLGFITYGGEVAVPIVQTGLYVIGGFEAFSVNRELPPELQQQMQMERVWDTIFPINAGLLYKLDKGGVAVPYFGADVVFAQYYVDRESGKGSWASGARARVGADFFFTRAFGLTINGSLGFWSGKDWEVIDRDMKNTALLPQISGGAVFRL